MSAFNKTKYSILLQTPDEKLKKKFRKLKTAQDVADLLEIKHSTLVYYLYVNLEKNYCYFDIPKKSGGKRTITAPIASVKILQQKLLYILTLFFKPRITVHGFAKNKSILTNATLHCKKRYVLNIDLEDFFPSINFGRVWGIFQSYPFNLNNSVASTLAQLCCHNNELPQGAPTSPLISNLICYRLDGEMQNLAKKTKSIYTRYADDITFSTTLRNFPSRLGTYSSSGNVLLGDNLVNIIKNNGFEINKSKVRLQSKFRRQDVTGLTVNQFPNIKRKFVRQIRAMLHDWERNGLDQAQTRHYKLFANKTKGPYKNRAQFNKIVKGKIDFLGMVRGKTDNIYLKLLYKYAQLDENYEFSYSNFYKQLGIDTEVSIVLFTEGKTDWMHVEAAHNDFKKKEKFLNLSITYYKEDQPIGDDKLFKKLKNFSELPRPHDIPMVFLFDRDNDQRLNQANLAKNNVHNWEMNVYAIALPVPVFRKEHPKICIEHLYKDVDLFRKDSQGRRIYLSYEFDKTNSRHKTDDLNYGNFNKLSKLPDDHAFVIDDTVFNNRGENMALSKAKFAENIYNQEVGFQDIDYSSFTELFKNIEKIARGEV